MKYVVIALVLGSVNFLYQGLSAKPSFEIALERSVFQSAALLIVWVLETFPDW